MLQIMCILVIVTGLTLITPFIKNMERYKASRMILWILFCVYVIGNMYCTIFSRVLGSGVTVELRPFMSIFRLFGETMKGEGQVVGFFTRFMNDSAPYTGIILNILLYYPLGYLVPILFPKLKTKHVIMIGCLCSIATEATQYLLKMGWCETDDVIYNTLGTAIGVWVWLWQSKRLNARRSTPPEVVEKKPGQN